MASLPTPALPLAPFKRYVRDRQQQYAREHGIEEDQSLEGVAPQLRLTRRNLQRWLYSDGDTVPYDTVDKVMGTDAREVYGNVVLSLVNPDPKRKETFFCQQCGNELRWKAELCGFCIAENELEDQERIAA